MPDIDRRGNARSQSQTMPTLPAPCRRVWWHNSRPRHRRQAYGTQSTAAPSAADRWKRQTSCAAGSSALPSTSSAAHGPSWMASFFCWPKQWRQSFSSWLAEDAALGFLVGVDEASWAASPLPCSSNSAARLVAINRLKHTHLNQCNPISPCGPRAKRLYVSVPSSV